MIIKYLTYAGGHSETGSLEPIMCEAGFESRCGNGTIPLRTLAQKQSPQLSSRSYFFGTGTYKVGYESKGTNTNPRLF
jgi:hypothetical protein